MCNSTKYALDLLCAEIDSETEHILMLTNEHPTLNLLGDIHKSPFLRAVRRKAEGFGVDTTTTEELKPGPIVCDHEQFVGFKFDRSRDLDRLVSNHNDPSCVSEALFRLLKRYLGTLAGLDVTIVGRGHAVQGLAQMLLDENATVTVAHSGTTRLWLATRGRDVVIYATPELNQPVATDTGKLVVDLSGCFPYPDLLKCSLMDRIGPLTVSVMLNRYAVEYCS